MKLYKLALSTLAHHFILGFFYSSVVLFLFLLSFVVFVCDFLS